MKTTLFFVLSCSAIFFSCKSATPPHRTGILIPSTILLVDAASGSKSVTIECVKKGNTWQVADSAKTARYLVGVASDLLEHAGVGNFHHIQVGFDSLYQRGALLAMGRSHDRDVPVGIEFSSTAVLRADILHMGNPVMHTCICEDCGCCTLDTVLKEGRILGCSRSGCPDGTRTCNHKISAQEPGLK